MAPGNGRTNMLLPLFVIALVTLFLFYFDVSLHPFSHSSRLRDIHKDVRAILKDQRESSLEVGDADSTADALRGRVDARAISLRKDLEVVDAKLERLLKLQEHQMAQQQVVLQWQRQQQQRQQPGGSELPPLAPLPGLTLPPLPSLAHTAGESGESLDALEASKRFWEHIMRLQNPPDCSTARVLYMSIHSNWMIGLGAYIDNIMAGFIYAVSSGRTFILQTGDLTDPVSPHMHGWHLAKDACPAKSYLCYFHAYSKCTESSARLYDEGMTPLHKATGNERAVYFDRGLCWSPECGAKDCETCDNFYIRSFPMFDPSACPTCPNSKFFLESHLLRYMFRPLPHIMNSIQEAKQRLKWRNPVIGLHVRRGDKVTGPIKESVAYDLPKYLMQVRDLGIKTFFIATDDPVIKAEAAKQTVIPDIELLFDDSQVRHVVGSVLLSQQGKSYNTTEELINAIKDIYLLGQTDYFVGTKSSFFSRNAIRLHVALHGNMTRWYTVDRDPWGNWPWSQSYVFG